MPSSHLILCHPLFLLPLIPPSIRVFSNEPTLRMRWPKYWSFSFSIIPSKEHPGPISFISASPKMESVQFSSVSQSCPPLVLPPILPSIRVFTNQPTLRMRWPKYWSFSFSIIPSKEHQGLISSRTAWLDLLAVQWTLKSLLQHHSSKASILWCSASSQSNSQIHT